ncbi:MAG TPA: N-acetylmuramoyl-L-alanine amidase [Verrucomicrobiae bacterium]|nr:N-acetylmuramoyl-L-alanine amidase [Verrucomicrobiae bacterium]
MKRIAALAISVPVLLAQSERAASLSVTAIRNYSVGEITRIAIEVSGEFNYRTDRLHNPERVYFDILNSRPRLDNRRVYAKDLDGTLVERVRVAETAPGITRVVLDLVGTVDVSTTQLSNPNRLIVEVRAGKGPAIPTESMPPPPPPAKIPPAVSSDPPAAATPATAPPAQPEALAHPSPAAPPKPEPRPVEPRVSASAPPPAPKPLPVAETAAPPTTAPTSSSKTTPPPSAEVGKAARHTSTGGSSLTRALGLKVGRIVIDPGHGGHDTGTLGVKGLLEKDLVLDVAQRVGKLIEERLNAEVIYTRTDDTFVPLQERTALANEKKADLFLSIHANSSPLPKVAGIETFYLNFTDSKEALDVAARENASSQKSIFELQDIIQKITLHEKLDESKEFATRIQNSLYTFTSRNVPGERNRGIKKAPFVVLIGASMPSVLAEIGFLTNAREEAQLKRSDYRQKLAEAMFRGISRYAESLSHFQVAQNQQ